MDGLIAQHGTLLEAARERGRSALEGRLVPQGLDHFALYAGLIGKALDLAKLIATEERDLSVISAAYEVEMSIVTSAFREVEMAMLGDFERDRSIRERTFEAINLLIEAGQYEVASEFHKRLIEGFHRPSLETIVAHRNEIASSSTTRLRLK